MRTLRAALNMHSKKPQSLFVRSEGDFNVSFALREVRSMSRLLLFRTTSICVPFHCDIFLLFFSPLTPEAQFCSKSSQAGPNSVSEAQEGHFQGSPAATTPHGEWSPPDTPPLKELFPWTRPPRPSLQESCYRHFYKHRPISAPLCPCLSPGSASGTNSSHPDCRD